MGIEGILLILIILISLVAVINLNGEKETKSEPSEPLHKNELIDTNVLHIIDGDTIIVGNSNNKFRVRLDSIDCPEDGQPWGNNSKFALIKLIGGNSIRLEPHGYDKYERMVATVFVKSKSDNEWTNVNAKMVVCGHAWVMRRFYKHLSKERKNDLNSKERWAKTKKVGLWKKENPIPPWEWREETEQK